MNSNIASNTIIIITFHYALISIARSQQKSINISNQMARTKQTARKLNSLKNRSN